MDPLLTRDEFRSQVFARDGATCVMCGSVGVDAHHIIERKLWPDGGYYLDNGATLCETCHIKAEATVVSCQEIRYKAGVTKILLPPHLYQDAHYDKWGNEILTNGSRLKGELFDDISVQKILNSFNILPLFQDRVKYPRTYHVPWSPGLKDPKERMSSLEGLIGQDVVVSVKMDGENTTFYNNAIHARSLDYSPHASRNRIKAFHAQIAQDIPEGWRICLENLYAKHSIHYHNLPDFWLGLSVWDTTNTCLSWPESLEWFGLLNIKPVKTLYTGIFDKDIIKNLYQPMVDGDPCEGYVIRLTRAFHYKEFRHAVAKYVRADHVQSHAHWIHNSVTPNSLTIP
jgi:hypothetical protein